MTTMTLVLEYFHPWPNSAGFYVARERGWFADHGIDLEIRTFDPGIGDSLEHLVRYRADVAVCPPNRLLARREAGQRLVGVAAANQRGLETVRTRRDSGIDSLAHLQGRRIAYNPTPRGHAVVRSLIARHGGDPSDYTPVDAGSRELDPADGFGGLADATYGSYWAWDNLLSSYPTEEQRTWAVDEALGLEYHSYVLATNEDLLAADQALLEEFLAVAARGFQLAAIDPELALAVMEAVTPYFPSAVLRKSLDLVSPTWFHDGSWGRLRNSHIAPYARWLADHGILAHPEAARQAFVDLSSRAGQADARVA